MTPHTAVDTESIRTMLHFNWLTKIGLYETSDFLMYDYRAVQDAQTKLMFSLVKGYKKSQ